LTIRGKGKENGDKKGNNGKYGEKKRGHTR